MYLKQLKLTQLRNLQESTTHFSPNFNVFYGKNGSGKTSFLEGMHLLATGRSFRSTIAEEFITFNHTACIAFAKGGYFEAENLNFSLGIERSKSSGISIQINHQKCSSIAELAKVLPLQLMNSEGYRILEGSSKYRRQFLDWGMFHVEHSFFPAWQRYMRALKQRNAALKRARHEGKSAVLAWNNELIDSGEEIHGFRLKFLETFIPGYLAVVEELLKQKRFSLTYHRGWNEKYSLSEALERNLELDLQRGYTQSGPHRADLSILVDESFVEAVLSRGQQKLLVCALFIARAEWLLATKGTRGIFLIDDLTSELDPTACRWLLERLAQMGGQVMITAIEKEGIQNVLSDSKVKMFHVEQGVIMDEGLKLFE